MSRSNELSAKPAEPSSNIGSGVDPNKGYNPNTFIDKLAEITSTTDNLAQISNLVGNSLPRAIFDSSNMSSVYGFSMGTAGRNLEGGGVGDGHEVDVKFCNIVHKSDLFRNNWKNTVDALARAGRTFDSSILRSMEGGLSNLKEMELTALDKQKSLLGIPGYKLVGGSGVIDPGVVFTPSEDLQKRTNEYHTAQNRATEGSNFMGRVLLGIVQQV